MAGQVRALHNPDVDRGRWLESARHLSELLIDVMSTGHGHIDTLGAAFKL